MRKYYTVAQRAQRSALRAALRGTLAAAGVVALSVFAYGDMALASPAQQKAAPRPAPKAPARAARRPAPEPAAAAPAAPELAALITLAEGKSKLLHLPYAAARVAVGNADVADVILLNPTEVYLLGKRAGATNLILWNKANQASIVDIAVNVDTVGLRQQLERLFGGEKDIVITAAADTLILSGTVSDVVKASQIAALAGVYVQRAGAGAAANPAAPAGTAPLKVVNMLGIAAPQQVMLEVQIAEVSKSLVDQLGASLGINIKAGNWNHALLSNLLSGNPSMVGTRDTTNGNNVRIDAQKRDGLVKVLAEPTIMAISGQEASFLAGGKVFIPVSQNHNNGIPTITLEEKEFGVAVKFTPTVLDGGRINLKVAPEVSELNKEGIGVAAAGLNATAILPSFTTRRATTTVQLFDGQSFAIGGLIKNNVTSNIKALPLLGEVPVLGALFRSSDFQNDRSELVFIVTPHLVKPLAQKPALPTDGYVAPSRAEFFLHGKQEGAAAPSATPN
ncbi:type II and III secretion system protein family protein [Janthinobacterium fluminis]|uniref:Type II and III secretion system protein family protein n=1 Tax=Janthinobacterium fluminis TaxID=2987524 RepID=A0ABT5JZ75_9BURK|nr:type II and III secretion system protein family protein [Janthinobacterium fluminis]MDC8758027.1 type II and III secretion system protein family protein [Janthinobacterium fluminis]